MIEEYLFQKYGLTQPEHYTLTEGVITGWHTTTPQPSQAELDGITQQLVETAATEREQQRNPDKADFRASLNADIQTIDDYFAIATPTNAQHFAHMRAMSRVMRRVLRLLRKELL